MMNEISWPRRYYWSLRREIWEHPSIWIAPLAAAVLVLLAFLISLIGFKDGAAAKAASVMAMQPFDFEIGIVMLSTYVVAVFYSLDTLYGERRDRSILFWKSLPVSDATTILAKLTIPMVVLPLITSAVTIAALAVMMLLSGAHLPLLRTSVLLVYHMFTVHSLWWAPLFGWLFFMSAWARRAPFVWALLPLVVIGFLEQIAFHTMHITTVLSRFSASPEAIVAHGKLPTDPATQMTPGLFVTSLSVWVGLGITAVFIYFAIQLRRSRGPI